MQLLNRSGSRLVFTQECRVTHLAVEAEQYERYEEEDRPQWSKGQLRDGFRVSHERQSRT